jgi:3-oxoacyl-[acyl-carrier-protein] synthase III
VIPQTEDLAGDRAPGRLILVAMRNGTARTTTSPRRAIPEARPRAARIASIGTALPAGLVANAPIADRIGVTDDWIIKRTGIRSRHVAAAGERLSELAAGAGARALELAGIDGGDVDLVLVATTTADELLPNAAPLVAHALGARRAGAIDVGAACTGFLSGLALATAQIEAARAEAVLLVGADLMTRITDPDCRHTAALFGDGAGAAVLTAAGGDGGGWIGATTLGADGGAGAELIVAERQEPLVRMQGHETFKHAVARMSQATLDALARAELALEDIDLFVYHQANARILRAVGEQLGIDDELVVDCIAHFGNTSAATLPLALAHAQAEGRLSSGDLVLLGAFGAGFTWGAAVVEWG